jgi:predicted alpha/beta-hydrolase family hydrolase
MILAPGASASRDQSALVAIDEALSRAGLPGVKAIAVERVDFPYRLAGRRAPDRPAVLVATLRDAAVELAGRLGVDQASVGLGGRSMGGRMASMAVAEGLPAAGLVLVSYPLHPPGKPEKLRDEHFPSLTVPCLFVSGTRDAFATPEELRSATSAIPGPVAHVFIDGGDHSLRSKDADVAAAVSQWVRATFAKPDGV